MKLILNILLLILIISTFLICLTRPKLHKTVLVYNSEYSLLPENGIKIEEETIEIIEKPVIQKISSHIQENVVQKTEAPNVTVIKNVVAPKVLQKKIEQKNNQVKTETKIEPIKKEELEVVTKVVNEEPQKLEQIVLTEKEEIIAWNKWRSDLQNWIMSDCKLPEVPDGIVFKFYFNVDKYGRVTNLQTWSDNQGFTPYAIQYIAPVIRNLQGKSILAFPAGTNRTITEVKGGWKISRNERFSNPSDYNDIEKIRK